MLCVKKREILVAKHLLAHDSRSVPAHSREQALQPLWAERPLLTGDMRERKAERELSRLICFIIFTFFQ